MQNKTFVLTIRRVLKEKRITKSAFRQMLEDHGFKMHITTLNNYLTTTESAARNTPIEVMFACAEILNIKFIDLFDEKYAKHDDKCKDRIELENFSVTKAFNEGGELVSTIVNNPVFDFNKGDAIAYDKSETGITSGFYIVLIADTTRICKAVFDGFEYALDFGAGSRMVGKDDFKVIGKIVMKLTKQLK